MICKACGKESIKFLMGFDKNPISHHFKNYKKSDLKEKFINLKFYQCQKCGLLQLSKTFRTEFLKSKNIIIRQKEPEDHLNRIVKQISALPGINKDTKIVGLSYKDQSVLERFNKIGFLQTRIIDFRKDNEIKNPDFEILDQFINPKNLSKFSKKFGKADIIISRHFLEHTHSIKDFLNGTKFLLKGSKLGYIFFEVPDCERSLKAFDYPMIWEQHKVYFTNYTFNATLKKFNFKKIFSGLAKYKYEDCLLYIGKLNDFENIKNKTSKKKLQKEINTAQKFFSKFKVFKNKIFLFFKNLKKNNVNIALYGGGHNGVIFLSLFKIKRFIDLVLDDNRNFQELFLPGSDLRVKNPKHINKKIDYCFLSANFENEKKIIKKNKNLLSKNGKFVSISFHNPKGIKKFLSK